MAIWVSSDWHCAPDNLKEAVVDWIGQGKQGNHRLVGDGDLFDILPWGREKWQQAGSIQQLATLLDGYQFDYVAGNHDPYNIMEKLVAPYPNITVIPTYDLFLNHEEKFLYNDHFHPNQAGYERIAERIIQVLK